MTFGDAVEKLKQGFEVTRTGWNGKGMFLFLIKKWDYYGIEEPTAEKVEHCDTLPFICMKTADGKLVPWLASQTDVLAEDWAIKMVDVT